MTPADLAAIEDVVHRAEHGPYESLTKLHNAMIAVTPALLAEVRRLQADNERMRRGLEEIASRYAEHEECRNSGCSDPDADVVSEFGTIAVNLLAGREWSEGD